MIETNGDELNNFKYIDLFCGIGGFHIALSSFGAKCVFASDIDKYAQNIYKTNFGIQPHGDIKKIKCKDIPSHDILCAGFPCQPFSISGHQHGFEDASGNGKLFFEIIRIVRYHKPKLVLLENVRNLEYHNNGQTLKIIKTKLNSVGYYVFCKTLNASDFGIPQARQRLYIVAFKKSLRIKNFVFPSNTNKQVSLSDILLDDENINENVQITREYTIDKPEAVYKSNRLIRVGKIGLGRQGERIYSPLGHSVTLSSQSGGIGGKTGMYYVNGNVRKLCSRECARLMGFPDSYILPSNTNTTYAKFGNSVVVDVLQYILKEIIKYL